MKKVLLVMVCCSFINCAHCQVSSSYVLARAIVQCAEVTLSIARGIFEQWVNKQTDTTKVADARTKFEHIMLLVEDGLKSALDAIDIAEKLSTSIDVVTIMAAAESAYKDLRQFLNDLTSTTMPTATKERVFTVRDLPYALVR
jgi:hypothetical protein